jgi:hypothetical protein
MSSTNVALVVQNSQEPNLSPKSVSIHQVRRMCRRHGLRLVKDRNGASGPGGQPLYELQATVRVAGEFTPLMLTDIVAIIARMEGVR